MGKRSKKKSSKGALIKGMTSVLPSELLTEVAFKNQLKKIMKGYAGIYALYRRKTLYYVGLTTNLFSRIGWHLQDRHAGKWDGFKIFRIKRVNYLKDLETLILSVATLKGNRSSGKVPKDADLSRAVRKVVREHEATVRSLKKALR
jgi:predicted GIY-YIG superfamily endonuclease